MDEASFFLQQFNLEMSIHFFSGNGIADAQQN